MFNGPLLNRRIADSQGRLAKLISQGKEPGEIVDEFYQRALSRRPSEKEREYWNKHVATTDKPGQQREVLEDFVWSLLTCREATTNH
jgi:hypothetical protein